MSCGMFHGGLNQTSVDRGLELRALIAAVILADNDPRRENRLIVAVQHQPLVGNVDPDAVRRQPPRQPAFAFEVYLDLAQAGRRGLAADRGARAKISAKPGAAPGRSASSAPALRSPPRDRGCRWRRRARQRHRSARAPEPRHLFGARPAWPRAPARRHRTGRRSTATVPGQAAAMLPATAADSRETVQGRGHDRRRATRHSSVSPPAPAGSSRPARSHGARRSVAATRRSAVHPRRPTRARCRSVRRAWCRLTSPWRTSPVRRTVPNTRAIGRLLVRRPTGRLGGCTSCAERDRADGDRSDACHEGSRQEAAGWKQDRLPRPCDPERLGMSCRCPVTVVCLGGSIFLPSDGTRTGLRRLSLLSVPRRALVVCERPICGGTDVRL